MKTLHVCMHAHTHMHATVHVDASELKDSAKRGISNQMQKPCRWQLSSAMVGSTSHDPT